MLASAAHILKLNLLEQALLFAVQVIQSTKQRRILHQFVDGLDDLESLSPSLVSMSMNVIQHWVKSHEEFYVTLPYLYITVMLLTDEVHRDLMQCANFPVL